MKKKRKSILSEQGAIDHYNRLMQSQYIIRRVCNGIIDFGAPEAENILRTIDRICIDDEFRDYMMEKMEKHGYVSLPDYKDQNE